MIWLYTGTPGSGKSLHAAHDIVRRLKKKGGLICNFPVNDEVVKKPKTHSQYWDNSELTPACLAEYALNNHKIGKENQCLVVIDEAQVIFNCREFGKSDRAAWVQLFCQHRKLGYNFILITQNDRMLDRQIRALVEYQVKHRKVNNYGFGGLLLSLTFMSWFMAIETWYGMTGKEAITGRSVFTYSKKYSKVYDSYRLFSELVPGQAGGDRASGGALDGSGDKQPEGSEAVMIVKLPDEDMNGQKVSETA